MIPRQYVTAALRPKEGYDIREEVARTVIQHGWPLREIRLESATLEEFFVQVTAQQAEAVMALSREVIERVVWEVVPQLAEILIKEEIARLTKE